VTVEGDAQNVAGSHLEATDRERPAENTTKHASQSVGIAKVVEAHRGERHIVVLHDYPDPDVISSAFAQSITTRRKRGFLHSLLTFARPVR
jgi:hypothetical protein